MVECTTRLLVTGDSGRPVAVECAPEALEEARRLSVDGLLAFSHGGREIGGVFYGTRNSDCIRVLSAVELACEHALGPRFVLSENDRAELEHLLQPPDGMEVVGWFRAHTRSGLELDGNDRQIFDRYFGADGHVALILKPTHWGTAGAAIYVREPSGEIRPETPEAFDLKPLNGPVALAEDEIAESSEVAARVSDVQPPAVSTEVALMAPAVPVVERLPEPYSNRPRTGRWKWMGAAAALVALIGALFYFSRPARGLELQAYATAPGMVRIEWNRKSPWVLNGTSGVLEIRDGNDVTNVPLDSDGIRLSSFVYGRRSGHVTVRLKIVSAKNGGDVAQETVQFISGAPAPDIATEMRADATAPPQALPPDPKSRPVQPTYPVDQANRIAAEDMPIRRPARRLVLDSGAAAPKVVETATLPAAPAVSSVPDRPMAMPDLLSNPALKEKPPAPPSAKGGSFSGPRAGRFIWTGLVEKRGVIEMDHAHVTIGAITGSFPAVPVALRALPAEFGHDGLTVYTAELARNGISEPPTRLNGWNGMHFKFDYERSHELVVLEWPNRSNEYTRLVLRNDGRPCSVIVVDWSVQLPQ